MDAGWSTITRTAPNFAASLSKTARSFRLAVGQLLVEDLLAGRSQPVPVMRALADVQAEEHAHVFGVEHRPLPGELNVPAPAVVPYARIHVMQTCRPRAVRRCAGPGGGRTSHQRLRRHHPSPVTPPGHPFDRGTQSCRTRRPAALLQDRGKHTGGDSTVTRPYPRQWTGGHDRCHSRPIPCHSRSRSICSYCPYRQALS